MILPTFSPLKDECSYVQIIVGRRPIVGRIFSRGNTSAMLRLIAFEGRLRP